MEAGKLEGWKAGQSKMEAGKLESWNIEDGS
jgi:hypothetical protein